MIIPVAVLNIDEDLPEPHEHTNLSLSEAFRIARGMTLLALVGLHEYGELRVYPVNNAKEADIIEGLARKFNLCVIGAYVPMVGFEYAS